MAIWPFNRKKASQADQNVPDEVREYYESGNKRTGMAWLLAFATLVVTILLAMILFFGGRWVFRQFTDNDQPQPPKTEQTTTDELTPQQQPAPTAQQGSSSTSTTTPSNSTSTSTQNSSPTTGPSTTEVPNTGPGPEGLQ